MDSPVLVMLASPRCPTFGDTSYAFGREVDSSEYTMTQCRWNRLVSIFNKLHPDIRCELDLMTSFDELQRTKLQRTDLPKWLLGFKDYKKGWTQNKNCNKWYDVCWTPTIILIPGEVFIKDEIEDPYALGVRVYGTRYEEGKYRIDLKLMSYTEESYHEWLKETKL